MSDFNSHIKNNPLGLLHVTRDAVYSKFLLILKGWLVVVFEGKDYNIQQDIC